MANLLPEHLQNSVWSTIRAHFILVAAWVLLASALFSAVALLPSFLVLTFAVPAAESRTGSAVESKNASSVADIALAQSVIKGLAPTLSATSSPDGRIAAVVAAKPKSVKIEHVAYTVGKPSVLMIAGVAEDRDAINTFRAALLAADIGNVTVPVSALVGSTDGQFTLTVSGDF